jgi:hypothetical protein
VNRGSIVNEPYSPKPRRNISTVPEAKERFLNTPRSTRGLRAVSERQTNRAMPLAAVMAKKRMKLLENQS